MIYGLLLAAASAVAAPAPGTYAYVSTMNGAQIGRSTITVSQASTGLALSETGSGSMNGQSGSVQDTLTLDGELRPAAYTAVASIADSRNMRSSIAFTPAQASQSGDVVKTYRLSANARHFVLLDVGPFSGFFILPAQIRAWGYAPVTAIVPNFAHSEVITPSANAAARPAGVPAGDNAYQFDGMVSLTVWFDPKTLIVDEVDVPTQGLIVRRV